MAGRFNGETAIVTGGEQGIVPAVAKLFAREDAKVFITGRTERCFDDTVAAVKAEGRTAAYMVAEAGSRSDASAVVASAVELSGCINILDNDAQISACRYARTQRGLCLPIGCRRTRWRIKY